MENKNLETKGEGCCGHSEGQKKPCSKKPLVIILILLCTVLNIASTYVFINGLPKQFSAFMNRGGNVSIDEAGLANKIMAKMEEMEAMRVGGSENYEMLKKLYNSEQFKEQQKGQLSMALAQFEGSNQAGENPNNNANVDENGFATGKLTAEEITKIKENGRISGNKDAKISWFEFSDLECPFCKKLHDNGTVKDIRAKYGDQINYMIKSFPLPSHANAQKASEAMECVGELGGDEKYYEFEEKAFAGADVGKESLKKIVKELGIKESKFDECVNSGKYADKVNSQKKEGEELFKIQGTPGSVLINIETGEWTLIPGAYPTSEFEKVIDKLLGK